ncbi:ABC transporter ATP-binding protein [Senegalia massiliensis]|uniref:ATP-binding cassette domain-containing protein n=1 Tax=Senegalia massiliensis TaxID=1720316 RepID=A0A845R1B6_9CLOT|nr:ATP-binding cassette domain-containing protein [Senegalia massiliensis]NBI06363.1 ATP-binding cassette domain-containing protein [Senegalia massiliensis]
MIEVKDLVVKYGDEVAINKMNLFVEKNTTCAIIGASGCGKTTLLYSLAGLVFPDKGSIYIDGIKNNGIRKNTAVILQNHGLLPWKTVWDNVALGLKARGVVKEKINDKVESILKELSIYDYKDKYPIELSGGQSQRVGICRALAINPDLLLMDEPTSALDQMTKEKLQNLVLKIYKNKPLTIVSVTHNIEEAVFLGQKIVIMNHGNVKSIINNPYFGVEQSRNQMEFYEMCLRVRKLLEEDRYYEKQ